MNHGQLSPIAVVHVPNLIRRPFNVLDQCSNKAINANGVQMSIAAAMGCD
jgi:hypothetical protein